MPEGTYTITADSQPDYDGWGYDKYWGAQHWMSWHAAMKLKYGKAEADNRFVNAWIGGQSYGAAQNDWLIFNSSFRAWANAENLREKMNGSIIDSAANLVDNVATSAANAVENTGDATENLSKVLKWVVPILGVVIVVAVVYVLFNSAKSFKLQSLIKA